MEHLYVVVQMYSLGKQRNLTAAYKVVVADCVDEQIVKRKETHNGKKNKESIIQYIEYDITRG